MTATTGCFSRLTTLAFWLQRASRQEATMRANVNQIEHRTDDDIQLISEIELDGVTGGEFTANFDNRRTNYARCMDAASENARARFPSTWRWYNPFSWFSDGNAQARAEAQGPMEENCRRSFGERTGN